MVGPMQSERCIIKKRCACSLSILKHSQNKCSLPKQTQVTWTYKKRHGPHAQAFGYVFVNWRVSHDIGMCGRFLSLSCCSSKHKNTQDHCLQAEMTNAHTLALFTAHLEFFFWQFSSMSNHHSFVPRVWWSRFDGILKALGFLMTKKVITCSND